MEEISQGRISQHGDHHYHLLMSACSRASFKGFGSKLASLVIKEAIWKKERVFKLRNHPAF